MKNHGYRLFVIAAITALCVWLYASWGIKFGLDLAGGSSLTYDVRTTLGESISKEKLEKAIEVINNRVNATGLTEIFITSTAEGQIVVEMPKRSNDEIASVKTLIERNGQLEFRIREEFTIETTEREKRDANPVLYRSPPDRRWVPLNPKEPDFARYPDYLLKVPEEPLRKKWEALRAEKGDADAETRAAEQNYYEKAAAEVFKGEDLDHTGLTTNGAAIVVQFEFKQSRKNDFKDFTERNVKKQMAIILDGKVNSAPNINSVLPGGGIIEGGGSGFTKSEADELRIVLESGSTGVQLALERQETLGASLGDVAVERGKWSVIVGFLAVVASMVVYYRMPGMIANLALLLNVIITLGAMAFFRGALSLPGIAGIVLSIGMAVDANILIFERLRDERKRGKSLRESLAAGYDNAMSAIVDGNVTALLTAFVLIWLGTGTVRGFGVTLTIGLLTSMFTAIWVTRAVFEWLVDRGWMTSFDIGPDPKEPKWDYLRGRKRFILPSLFLMVAGTVAFLARDPHNAKDLEFTGGQQVIVQLREPLTSARITEFAKGPDDRWVDATAVALAPEGVDAPKGTTNRWQIRAKANSPERGAEYEEYLRQALADLFVPSGYADWKDVPASGDQKARTTFLLNTLEPIPDPAALKSALEGQELAGLTVEPVADAGGRAHRVGVDAVDGGEPVVKERVRKALAALPTAVQLSDPIPARSFLSPEQAENHWRTALKALLVALVLEVLYIRMRFADYTHGFACSLAMIHDVTIALGAVAVFDSLDLVYAKVNLVLIAGFLTLIGYSINDKIVVFDRIRENLGRTRVIRSRLVNDSINQTFARSVRTSVTVLLTVLAQFVFNRGMGSSIEGFAWVMIIGVLSGVYSSVFIAAPLLLFLPAYSRKVGEYRLAFAAMCVAAIFGAILALGAEEHGARMWIGVALAAALPLHFLSHLIPWLNHPDPDSLVIDESGSRDESEPTTTPGV